MNHTTQLCGSYSTQLYTTLHNGFAVCTITIFVNAWIHDTLKAVFSSGSLCSFAWKHINISYLPQYRLVDPIPRYSSLQYLTMLFSGIDRYQFGGGGGVILPLDSYSQNITCTNVRDQASCAFITLQTCRMLFLIHIRLKSWTSLVFVSSIYKSPDIVYLLWRGGGGDYLLGPGCCLWSMQNNTRLEPYVIKFIY